MFELRLRRDLAAIPRVVAPILRCPGNAGERIAVLLYRQLGYLFALYRRARAPRVSAILLAIASFEGQDKVTRRDAGGSLNHVEDLAFRRPWRVLPLGRWRRLGGYPCQLMT